MNVIKRSVTTLFLAALLVGPAALAHGPTQEGDHESFHEQLSAEGDEEITLQVRKLVESFRVSGDDRLLDEAWHRLEAPLGAVSVAPSTLIAAAFVAQARHQFDLAIDLVSRALRANGNNDEGWLLLASIYLVQGERAEAASACRQLSQVAPLVILTCKARVALLSGDQAAALPRLARVLDIESAKQLPAEVLAWSYAVAGDLAMANNDRPRAIAYFNDSLELAESSQVRSVLVDVELQLGDYLAAERSLNVRSEALPLLIRRMIVAKRLRPTDYDYGAEATLNQEFAHMIEHGDWLHAREMARFYLDVAERANVARRLALINIERQKEPEDLRLVRRTAASAMVHRSD